MPAKIDLTGQTFGSWTVVSYVGYAEGYKCQCDCGEVKNVLAGSLTKGKSKSCGHPEDLCGAKFGRLKVLARSRIGIWQCVCDCGQTIEVSTTSLKTGNTKSCGCLRRERASERVKLQLAGRRVGKLLVLSEYDKTKASKIRWLCQCDCGGTTIVVASHLVSGATVSCGCAHKEMLAQKAQKIQLYGVLVSVTELSGIVGRPRTNVNEYLNRGFTAEQILSGEIPRRSKKKR